MEKVTNNDETVDILVPVYNGEKFIQKCLESLENQTYEKIRIVIVNDGSTDKSAKILQNFQKTYQNIEIYEKINENSISKTRNFLLSKIKSNYFTFFDIDDYAEPTYIETLYLLSKNYGADVSLCGKKRHHENKNVNLKRFNKKQKKVYFLSRQDALAEMISTKMYNGTVYAKLFKTSLLGNIKFDENIHYGEDLDFCFQIMSNAEKFVMTKQKLYHYIVHENSIVSSKFSTKKLTLVDSYNKIIEATKENEELFTCAKSMMGAISIELLYYTWRDKYKNKETKKMLKGLIKESFPYTKKNKRTYKIFKCIPLVWWIIKLM